MGPTCKARWAAAWFRLPILLAFALAYAAGWQADVFFRPGGGATRIHGQDAAVVATLAAAVAGWLAGAAALARRGCRRGFVVDARRDGRYGLPPRRLNADAPAPDEYRRRMARAARRLSVAAVVLAASIVALLGGAWGRGRLVMPRGATITMTPSDHPAISMTFGAEALFRPGDADPPMRVTDAAGRPIRPRRYVEYATLALAAFHAGLLGLALWSWGRVARQACRRFPAEAAGTGGAAAPNAAPPTCRGPA